MADWMCYAKFGYIVKNRRKTKNGGNKKHTCFNVFWGVKESDENVSLVKKVNFRLKGHMKVI